MSWIGYHDLVLHLLQLIPGDMIFQQDAAIFSYDPDLWSPVACGIRNFPDLVGL